MKNTIKRILKFLDQQYLYILALVEAVCLGVIVGSTSACSLIKDGEEIDWNKVDYISSTISLATQTTTYAVCIKNKDLAPVFKAIGEGLVIVAAKGGQESLQPEQIQAYVNELLKKEEWGTLSTQINGVLNTVFATYQKFVDANKDKFTDEARVLASAVNAIGVGFIQGSNIGNVGSSYSYLTEKSQNKFWQHIQASNLSVAKIK